MALRKTAYSSGLLGSDSGFGVGRYFSSCAWSRWGRIILLLSFASGYQSASAQSVVETFGTGSDQFTMEFVPIGNPNNPADTTGSPVPVGSVAYSYNLGKQEVSRDMISKANLAGNLGITMADMSSRGGNGVNWPATGITWNEAATYVNWLNTSTGGTPAYKFVGGTFTLWSPGDAGYNPNNQFRNSLAKYVIASNNEWYKGAYGNRDGTWNNYATGSDSAPTAVASGTTANTAVYSAQGPADITSAGGLSPYETMGQSGNVWEWNETGFDGMNNTADENREVRGGTWGSVSDSLGASLRFSYSPTFEWDDIGFRVAVVSLESPVVLSSGLLAALKFEGNLSDSSELGLHAGSWSGGGTPSYVSESPGSGVGAGTRSALFNGTTDRIDLANSAALNMNNGVPFSMSAWIKTDFNNGQRVILAKAAGAPVTSPALFVDSEGKLRFDNYGINEAHSSTTVRTGTWMHVAVTYDGSTYRLYVNGSADGEKAFTGSNDSGNSWTFSIGGSSNTEFPGGMFKGNIDEVQFWSRTLSPAEVATVADSGVSLNLAPSVPFTYTPNGIGLTITGYTGTGGAVVIPGTIGGLPVTKIGDSAFSWRTTLTSITIPDSILEIGQNAFHGCSGLLSASIGNGVTTLPRNAFTECVGLTSVSLGANVKTLGDYAFNNCKKLTSITFPAGFESTGTRAFALCEELTSITFPQSVTTIGGEAFYGCTKLATVYFQGNTPPTIEWGVFSGTASGAKGYYPAGATGYAYLSISGLTFEVTASPASDFTHTTDGISVTITGYTGTGGAVVIPGTIGGLPVTQIGNAAFKEKTSITAITFPDSVSRIGYEAFYHCDNLMSITFGSGLKTIGDWAFAWCGKLPTLIIPDSVTNLGEGAVSDCSALTSLTIGNQVPVIWRFTFSGDSNLTAVTLPASVGSIGEQAFSHCTKLATINFQQSVPPFVNGDAFYNIASGAIGYYLESASASWSGMSGAGSNSGNALSFNGNNQYLVAGTGTDHVLTTGTIECWIRSDVPVADTDGFHGIMVKQGSYGLFLKGNELIAYDWQNGGERRTFRLLRDERNNAWHHVAMSFQSGVTDGTVIYLDGQPVLTTTYTVGSSADPLAIGAGFASSSQLFQGMMDEVRVWNIVRTPAQIATYRNVSVPPTSSGLVSYFKLDESSGSSAGNAVLGGATATAYNSPSWNSLSISGLTFPQIKVSQTINFGALPNKTVGDGAFALAATASSGLAVSYVSSDLNVATVTGNTVTILGDGTTTITASQPGDATYHAATSINVLLTVSGSGGGVGSVTSGVVGGGLSQVSAPVLNLPATLTYGQKMILPGAAQSLQVLKSVNQTIPDGTPESSTSSSATVSGLTGSNYSFTLGVKIVPVVTGGGFLGDLRAYLRHELLDENGGTLVNQTRMLIDQIGVTQTDLDGSLADGLSVIFGDSFSDNIQNASASRGTLLSGNFAPASSFAGTDPARAGPFSGLGGTSNLWNGTYRLVVADMSTGAEMKLDSWSMQFHSLAASVGVGNPLVVGNPGEFSPEGGLIYEIVESGLGTQENGLGKIDANQLEAKSGTGTITIRAKYAATGASTAGEWTTKTILLAKRVQTITFPELGTRSLAPTFTVGATTDSLLPLTYSSSSTGTATIGASGQITPVAVGTTTISVAQVGDANFSEATVSRLLTIAGTPLNPSWGLSKLYSQDSTNSAVAGVTKGTNTSAYTKIEYAEAPATAQIAMVPISFGGNEVVNLTQTNGVAPGVIGYSSWSNPASFTSYSEATAAVPAGDYTFVGKNASNAVVTNAVVIWSNNTNDYPVQAPQIGGTWVAQSLRISNPAIADTISWAAWTNTPVLGSTNSIRVEVIGSARGTSLGLPMLTPSVPTPFVTNLPANSTNLAIPAGTLPTNQVYSAKVAFVTMTGGAARSTETQFRMVTGPMNPPASPILLGALIGNINVAPTASVVGTLAAFSDLDAGDTETLSLPTLTWPDSNDNNLFVLDGRVIKRAAGTFDSVPQRFFSILVRATDSYGLYSETAYTIVVRQDVSNDISLTGPLDSEYDGNPKSFLASVVGGAQFAIAYQGRNGTVYAASAIAPTNIGDYTVTATATDLDKIGSKSQEFTIRKATPTISAAPTASAITYGQTLANSRLTGGNASTAGTFAFTTTSTAPNAGTASQGLTFTPSDTANYNTTTTSVSVTVAKATPTINAAPTAGTLTYNQTLSYSSLTGGLASVEGAFNWKSSSTVPAANSTSSQSVVFTPSDTANYNAVELNVSVTVLNTLPTLASFSVNGTEDQTYTFTLGNFTGAYADTEGTSLGSITVERLPAAGLLKLGGANVVSNQVIPSNQISTLTYVPEANANGPVATFGVAASDGSGSSSQATVTILLAPANDQPTVQAPASFALTEDQPGNLTYESSPFGDSDSTILTVTLSVSDGVITGNAGTGITVGGTATARTFAGTLTDLNTYFTTAGSISYQGAQDNTASRVLTTLVSDGSLSANTSSTISFTPVNDAPVILSSFAVGFNEDGTSRAGWTNVNPNDNYGPNKPSWSIGELFATATGSSSLESAPLVAGTYTVQWEHGLPFDNSAPGTLQVSAEAVADGSSTTLYALGRSAVITLRTDTTWTTDSFTFTIPNGDPAIGRYLKLTFNYTAQYVWHDLDSVSVSVSGSSTLGIPALTEDVTGNLQFSGTPFSDADSPSLTVTLGVDVGTITGNPGTGITVGGTATARTLAGTVADLNTYFATAGKITYLAPPDFNGSKTLGILVSDGQLTATGSATINVQPSNDLPVLATPNAISYQDTSATDTFSPTSGTLSGADLDAETVLTYGISGGTKVGGASTKTGSYGTLAVTVATGAYTFTPNATAINALSSDGSEAYTVTVSDGTGLVSAELMVSIAGVKEDSTITVTGATSYTYSGGGQGPTTYNKSGSGGAVIFIYQGSGGTTYEPNSALPSNAGTYLATAAVAGDANFNPAASAAYAFTIAKADSTISATGAISYTYSASPQGPSTSDKNGSSGAVTYQYEGAGLTSYGPSSIPPLNAGSYSVTATVASDDNYNGKESSPLGFTIGKATPTVSIPPTASAIGLTESLSSSALSGGTASVQGSFAWTSGNNVPGVSGSYAVTFIPRDGANYNTASTTATLAVYDPDLPVPGADAFEAKLAAGMTTKVTLASLLTNDRPSANLADARTVTLESASLTSTGGGSIRIKSGWLIYQPSPSAQNGTSDTFTYTVSNGIKTATGTVTVSLAAPDYVAQVAIDRVSGSQVYFSVMPGMTFEVQGTSQLGTGATWTTIAGPNSGNWTSGADGRLIVTDPATVGAGSRFYRFKWVPGTVNLPTL